ncbi:transmembrane and coiled-coil domain-containing protein 4-like isoform X1 [Rhodamnia argentea]|uniref:Transmembrane and coiled-coil domain-containing protein 4-like isoform X1 n=2 Tax=Rhodamnia argentea TaxID=178133 RepID=A0A8B8NXC4_9MYRT|nr:transmembrane and coiled-coil domain-containing protein 4-like isoform X1 [Rhodamnia argentea]
MEASILTATQKYAACGLFALALHHSQKHQTRPWDTLAPLGEEPIGEGVSIDPRASDSEQPEFWVHEDSGLLWPVYRFLKVDERSWDGLKETAGSSSQVRHHVGAFLKLLTEDGEETCPERTNKELALAKAVDAMVLSVETSPVYEEDTRSDDYEKECREKCSDFQTNGSSEEVVKLDGTARAAGSKMTAEEDVPNKVLGTSEEFMEEGRMISRQRKVAVLYELLSACVADSSEDESKSPGRKGYDARHRVGLRLLATWLGIKWLEMEALEMIVACSMMSSLKVEGAKEEDTEVTENRWAKWKRGGIIGAAALGGGALMAITGGLAAPAIAQGMGALAPTLGSLIPAVGAGGFAAAATATGSAAGSAAVAASFGVAGAGLTGSKMARRIGGVEEFEFKVIGENHNQGQLAVEILVSGLAFESEDFVRPWEGYDSNLERYALQWESKNLIALSTAIQDWLTSRIAMELVKGGAMMTVLSTLVAALALPATLVTASDMIDSKWAIAIDRSDKAGELLSEVLLKGLQGNRPVTLIGFSLGARVIFKCLQFLAEASEDNARFVERVVLLGAPISIKDENWEIARKMVAGRFVNAYSTNDWTLGIAFRASLFSQGLAGIQSVNVPGVENVDVTELTDGHSSYLWTAKQILEQQELDSPYPVFRTKSAKIHDEKSCLTLA